MGPTPVYGARAEKPLQNADFAMKQTNICRLSGDIIKALFEKMYEAKQKALKVTFLDFEKPKSFCTCEMHLIFFSRSVHTLIHFIFATNVQL